MPYNKAIKRKINSDFSALLQIFGQLLISAYGGFIVTRSFNETFKHFRLIGIFYFFICKQ
jgi:hypothetical protein